MGEAARRRRLGPRRLWGRMQTPATRDPSGLQGRRLPVSAHGRSVNSARRFHVGCLPVNQPKPGWGCGASPPPLAGHPGPTPESHRRRATVAPAPPPSGVCADDGAQHRPHPSVTALGASGTAVPQIVASADLPTARWQRACQLESMKCLLAAGEGVDMSRPGKDPRAPNVQQLGGLPPCGISVRPSRPGARPARADGIALRGRGCTAGRAPPSGVCPPPLYSAVLGGPPPRVAAAASVSVPVI